MKYYKQILVFTASISLILLNFNVDATESIPEEAIEVARTTIIKFLSDEEARRDFESAGFLLPGDNVSDVELGRGVREYSLSRIDEVSTLENVDMGTVLEFVGWSFPVFVDGNPRMLITVEKRNGEWQFARLGKDVHPLIEARQRWPEKNGYSHSYARMFSVTDLIMLTDKSGAFLFYPYLENSFKMLGLTDVSKNNMPLLKSADVLDKLQKVDQGVKMEVR